MYKLRIKLINLSPDVSFLEEFASTSTDDPSCTSLPAVFDDGMVLLCESTSSSYRKKKLIIPQIKDI